MKTDIQLQRDVMDELQWQPKTRDAEIGVSAKGGVVTLTGTVASYSQKLDAAQLAESVMGVRAVADDMVIRLPNSSVRTDTDIAHSVVNALRWNIEVPDEKITTKVHEGWVTLHGTAPWQFQRNAAASTVRYLTGVKGVSNLIVVQPRKVAPEVVKEQIASALKRSATVDAARVAVESMPNGTVVLRGTVRSWSERQDAELAAWATPGVALVKDEIAVGV